MKKLQALILAVGLLAAAACHPGRKHVVVVKSEDNQNTLRLEYSGRIVFTEDNKGISSISPGGYLEYKMNDDELDVKSDHTGRITYQLNGDEKSNTLNEQGKDLLADAIKQIAKTQGKKL